MTSHNQLGQAVVAQDTQKQPVILPNGAGSVTIWSSESSPADVASPGYKAQAETGFTNNGSIIPTVDVPPRSVGGFHRTHTLDYVIVQKGSVTLTLDDGSRTRVSQGEIVVQQATMHGWDNETDE